MRILRSNDENIRWPKHEVTVGPDQRKVHRNKIPRNENKKGVPELPEMLTYLDALERFLTWRKSKKRETR